MRPAYEHPHPYQATQKNQQEEHHTNNTAASRTECTEATPHGDTVNQTADRGRTKPYQTKTSILHSINPRKEDDLNTLRHDKPTERHELRLQKK